MENLFHTPSPKGDLFDTYGKNLKDVDMGDVKFFFLAVNRKRYRYVTEVL